MTGLWSAGYRGGDGMESDAHMCSNARGCFGGLFRVSSRQLATATRRRFAHLLRTHYCLAHPARARVVHPHRARATKPHA
jgi:hypothetical protein